MMEAFDRVAVPGGVLVVLVERRRHRHPERLLVDYDVDAQLCERRVKARVEIGDGETICERERADAPVQSAYDQLMVDKVEIDLERRVAAAYRSRRQPTHVDIQGRVPP